MKVINTIRKLNKTEALLLLGFLTFSCFLMWKTFGTTPEGNIKIASRLWSDFAATVPLIRSFSFGSNFPPQYPIFAGPPIRYHFVFFAIVGFLEKIGLSLGWALNIPSAVSFFLLLFVIYLLGKTVFKSKAVGVISVLLFLFNSSLSFIEFFKTHPLSLKIIEQIINNNTFSSFGPYDGKIVSAFWSLNIFTNQRHLALAYASFLFLTLLVFKFSKKPKTMTPKKTLLIGIVIGLFPFVHMAVFGMMGIALIIFFLVYSNLRKKFFLVGIVALTLAVPQLLYMGGSEVQASLFNPGYLVEKLTLYEFLKYWFFNLGLTTLLAPVGFLLAKKEQRKIIIPFVFLFIIGNLFQLSPEIAANHKFFNLFAIGANMFSALFLLTLWKRHVVGKIIVPVLLVFLTLTGIIDFFPIVNDRVGEIKDYPNNKTVRFIVENTPKDAVFLNTSYIYNPASLAGRKIFLGWPYFSWSAGYNTSLRHKEMKKLFSPTEKTVLCSSLYDKGVNYVEIQKPGGLENILIDYAYFENNFYKIFEDGSGSRIVIYDVAISCKNIQLPRKGDQK